MTARKTVTNESNIERTGTQLMKIQEFRDKMKHCKREDIEKIAAELYKMLPKSKKEAEADPLIEDVISGKATSAATDKKKAAVIDFDE